MEQKETTIKKHSSRAVNISMAVRGDNHLRVKQIRRVLEAAERKELTLIQTYNEILPLGIAAMEAQLNIQPLKETA